MTKVTVTGRREKTTSIQMEKRHNNQGRDGNRDEGRDGTREGDITATIRDQDSLKESSSREGVILSPATRLDVLRTCLTTFRPSTFG